MVRGRAFLLLKALLGLWPLCCSGLRRRADAAVERTPWWHGRRRRSSRLRTPPQEGAWAPTESRAWERSDVWAPTNAAAWQRAAPCGGSCGVPPRVALAYRGDYHRRAVLSHGGGAKAAFGCSDFFHNADSHWQQLVAPLEAAGARVTTYFHSYGDASCPRRDGRLVRELRPARHAFSDAHLPLIVDSYLRVLQMVLQDEGSLDAVVLTRFDLRYRAPITSWNVQWNVTNVAHREGEKSWRTQRKLSDLFFVLPIAHVRPLMSALNKSAVQHAKRKAAGPGHWFYDPFVEKMGPESVHIIDQEFAPSTLSPSETSTFLGISRGCGASYDLCQS